MNGNVNVDGHAQEVKTEIHTQILRALAILYEPRSSNTNRQDASRYLEDVRAKEEAPYHGFELAMATEQPAIVRHYGLSLLEYAIRYRWLDYTPEQSKALRDWVVMLSKNILDRDPPYINNKVAEIWVEVAKKSWGLDWLDMDELLVHLWDGSVAHKALVLTILESLSEDVFGSNESTAALRGDDINKACVEIFTPSDVLQEHFPKREKSINVRCGGDGWLHRMAELLDWCTRDGKVDENRQICALKSLATFKSVISWVLPSALIATRSLHRICACLAVSNVPIQLVSLSAQSSYRATSL